MTINGVEIQCAKQSEHVNTPNKSELFVKNLILFNFDFFLTNLIKNLVIATKLQ